MGKLPPNGILPVRNLPSPVFTKEEEVAPPPHYLEYMQTRIFRALQGIARYYADRSRVVEEYAGESRVSATGETSLTVTPDYEPASECITSVLVTGPVTTAFVLQLGDRYMTLSTDATGKCLLAPVFFRLKPSSERILTSATAGSWFFQMSGYALGRTETS
jgi:hypothetical protein